jgi:hypothetical protein
MRVGELLLNNGVLRSNELMPPRYGRPGDVTFRSASPRGFFTRSTAASRTR